MNRMLVPLALLGSLPAAASTLPQEHHGPRAANRTMRPAAALPTDASEPRSFRNDVLPVLSKLGCNRTGCHGSPKGKSGFKLSLFGAEPASDYAALVRDAGGRRVNRMEPGRSLILLKATAAMPHGGGKVTDPSSSEYRTLARWIAAGTPVGTPNEPTVQRLSVSPPEKSLHSGEREQLTVTAHFSDGSARNVTALANYHSSDEVVASAERDGRLRGERPGEAAVTVEFLGKVAVSRVLVPTELGWRFSRAGEKDRGAARLLNPPVNGTIDRLVFGKLRKLGIPASELSSDEEFLRRVYLDVIGSLPTPDEARDFLAEESGRESVAGGRSHNPSGPESGWSASQPVSTTDSPAASVHPSSAVPHPTRRSRLIEDLLSRPEFDDFWSLKWGDLLRVKRGFPINLSQKGVWSYHEWIRQSIAEDKPYDQFVRELLTASGNTSAGGPANFYRAVPSRDPQTWAETTAVTFLGVRLDCAHCHNHPFEAWTWDDNFGLAAFFQVGFKPGDEPEDEVVYHNRSVQVRHTATNEVVAPRLLGGEPLTLSPGEDPRSRLADWITSPDNPWFARNAVNRVWYWLLGRGIVHEPDDFRSTNPPENPELLDYLAKELVEHHYDIKHIFRLILNSRTYQLSSSPNRWNAMENTHFSRRYVKRLGAEQLLDAVSQAVEAPEKFPGLPLGYRATQLPDSDVSSFFLDLFGRPARDITCECERSSDSTMPQALYLINSDHLEGKIRQSQRIHRLMSAKTPDSEAVEELYLASLSRRPTADEAEKASTFLSGGRERERGLQDLLWALLNSKEFMFNH